MVLNLNQGKLFYGRFVVLIHFYILHGVNNNNLPSFNLLLCSEGILEFISMSTFFNFQIFFCISTFQKIYGNVKWHIILNWNICFKPRFGYTNDWLQVWLLNLSRRSSRVSIIIFYAEETSVVKTPELTDHIKRFFCSVNICFIYVTSIWDLFSPTVNVSFFFTFTLFFF